MARTLISLAAVAALAAASAEAAVLRLVDRDDAATALVVRDNSALDTDARTGWVRYAGTIGAFAVDVRGYALQPAGRPQTLLFVSATSLDASLRGFQASMTHRGLTFDDPDAAAGDPLAAPFEFRAAGRLEGRVFVGESWVDARNRPGVQADKVGSLFYPRYFPDDPEAFDVARIGLGDIADSLPFSMTTRMRIINDDIGDISRASVQTSLVPLPAALPLLAAALGVFGLVGWGRRRPAG